MSAFKRSTMAVALLAGIIGAVGAPAAVAPQRKPARKAPPVTRYKAPVRVTPTKQDDQPAKEARRAARTANDAQLRARQEAKWGKP